MACTICLDSLTSSKDFKEQADNAAAPIDDQVISLECGHVYHQRCLDDVLENNRSCPSCRRYINKIRIRTIFLHGDEEKCNDCTSLEKKVEDLAESNDILLAQVASYEVCVQEYKEKIEELTVQATSLRMSMESPNSSSLAPSQEKEKLNKETIENLVECMQKNYESFVKSQRSDMEKILSLTNQVSDLRAGNTKLQKQNELHLMIHEADEAKIHDLTNEVVDLRKTNEASQTQIVALSESLALANEETEDFKRRSKILESEKECLVESLRWNTEKNQDLIAAVSKLRNTEKIWTVFIDLMERVEREEELKKLGID